MSNYETENWNSGYANPMSSWWTIPAAGAYAGVAYTATPWATRRADNYMYGQYKRGVKASPYMTPDQYSDYNWDSNADTDTKVARARRVTDSLYHELPEDYARVGNKYLQSHGSEATKQKGNLRVYTGSREHGSFISQDYAGVSGDNRGLWQRSKDYMYPPQQSPRIYMEPRVDVNGNASFNRTHFFHELGHADQTPSRWNNALRYAYGDNKKLLRMSGMSAAGTALALGTDNPYIQGAGALAAVGGMMPSAGKFYNEWDAWRRGAKMFKPYLQDTGRTFNRARYWGGALRPLMSYAAPAAAALGVGVAAGVGARGVNYPVNYYMEK